MDSLSGQRTRMLPSSSQLAKAEQPIYIPTQTPSGQYERVLIFHIDDLNPCRKNRKIPSAMPLS